MKIYNCYMEDYNTQFKNFNQIYLIKQNKYLKNSNKL